MSLRATVRGGRFVIDESTELPEGIVLDLVIDDEGDGLDAPGRAALDSAISRSLDAEAAGKTAPADAVLARLRARRAR